MKTVYENYWKFLEKREEFGTVQRPVIRWWRSEELNDLEKRYFDFLSGAQTVLDYGAGNLALKKKFQKAGFRGTYKTCDRSKNFEYDFHSLDQVLASGEKFDAILLLEIIEHMDLTEFGSFLPKILSVLKPHGRLILSTPNAHAINAVWSTDLTHVKTYPLPDLWALLSLQGFECHPFRVVMNKSNMRLSDWFRYQACKILTNLLGVDYAPGVVLLCQKRLL